MKRIVSANESRARDLFGASHGACADDLLLLASDLRDKDNNLEYSRRILEIASAGIDAASQTTRYKVLRDLMICTYKSPDQPLDERLKRAERLGQSLLDDGFLTIEQRQDVLGIMGTIWKARWAAYGLREHLETSLTYYRQGIALGQEKDSGYTAINAAFVLDLLAAAAGDADTKLALRADAIHIRKGVRDLLLKAKDDPSNLDNFWFLATLGEAHLGLREFPEAEYWMKRAGARQPPPWKLESTARQTATLASLIAKESGIPSNALETSKPWVVVRALMGGDAAKAMSFLLGKVGLALSGGGFRAALFHIGVLARLAELDMLRHIEVISCVSGGSIVGAFYYLELRKKLQEQPDELLQPSDYIGIVENVERKFLKGVQKNIRLRMLMEFKSNLRVLWSRTSSMTERLAELYDRELYSNIEDEFGGKRRRLSDILIVPKGASARFNPKYENWTRHHKVPSLILNATTLNTCHNWQFTAAFMGEPPARGIQADIDANDRLRRMYHQDAPPAWREAVATNEGISESSKLKLSQAVAASACVPMLFDPLVLDNVYGTTFDPDNPQKYITRLVDGGAYDNQGIASLLEQNCTVLLVSDACGQTSGSLEPGGGRLTVLQRTNDVLMARVREAQYQQLATLRDSGALRGLMYVHLKKDLAGTAVDWIDSPDRFPHQTPPTMTNYGMRRDIQKGLAAIRTDLDTFSDSEADALMLSGYLMTQHEFDSCIKNFPVLTGQSPWQFREIAGIAANSAATADTERLRKTIAIAASLWLKPWRASSLLKAVGVSAGVLAVAGLALVCHALWATPMQRSPLTLPIGLSIAVGAGVLTLLGILRWWLTRYAKYRNPYGQVLLSVLMCLVGWILLRLHLYAIEPFYRRCGPKYRGLRIVPPEPPDASMQAGAG